MRSPRVAFNVMGLGDRLLLSALAELTVSTGEVLRKVSLLCGLLVLSAGVAGEATARSLVDIDDGIALGVIVVDKQNQRVLYSLGNGRAISYQMRAGASGDARDEISLLEAGQGAEKPKMPSVRRNIRWR